MSDDNMRDSGIEWVGEIPAEWDVAKCQYVMMSDKKIAGMRSSEYQRISLTMNGVVPRDKNDRDGLQPRDFDSYQIVRQNQLIFKLIDLANKATSRVGLSPYEGITSPAYIIASCDEEHLTARYAYYYFTDMYFRYVFNGLGNDGVRSSLTKTALMNLKIVLPPLPEQRRIAAYLDARVSRIDRLVDGLSRRVELLDEYKKSLISETVTHGLEPNRAMKDSGIEWIGKIPAEWETIQAKYVFAERCEKGNALSMTLLSPTKQYGVVPQSMLASVTKCAPTTDFSKFKGIHTGDFCISLRSFQNGIEYNEKYEGIVSPAYHVIYITAANRSTNGYFRYLLKSDGFISKIASYSDSLRDGKNVSFKDFGNTIIPFPPLYEQHRIAAYLDAKTSKLDSLMSACKKQIDLLNEYKTSLISECVTGKCRITDADLEGVSVA